MTFGHPEGCKGQGRRGLRAGKGESVERSLVPGQGGLQAGRREGRFEPEQVVRFAERSVSVERLRRSVKYEEVYLNEYRGVQHAIDCLGRYFRFYNTERPHQLLSYETPATVYSSGLG